MKMTDSEALAVLDAAAFRANLGEDKCEYNRIVAARAHIADALRDAKRYRWLRNESIGYPYAEDTSSPWCVYGPNSGVTESRPIEGSELDAAIDAAMKDAT